MTPPDETGNRVGPPAGTDPARTDSSGIDPSGTPAERPATRTPAKRAALFALVAAVVLTLDIVSKVLVVAHLQAADATHAGDQVRLLGGAIYLDVARNSGAAFSLGTGFTVILSLIALAVVAVIVRFASHMRSVGWAIALGLILGGALGNLTDRIFRAPGVFRGHVVDWISLFGPNAEHWPIFNLADSAIVCGAILAALLSLFGIPLDGSGRDGSGRDGSGRDGSGRDGTGRDGSVGTGDEGTDAARG